MIELVPASEAAELMRADIVALISRNPFCPVAELLASALADLG